MTAWRLAQPAALALVVPFVWLWWRRARQPRAALRYSSLALFDFPGAGGGRARWLPLRAALRGAALGAGIVALARPQWASPAAADAPPLVIVLDASGSMGARDDQPNTRLERGKVLAKAAAAAWPGEAALVVFAATARPRCLPTHDAAAFRRTLAAVELDQDDNRTDIGAGLACGLEILGAGPGTLLLVTDGAQRLPDGANPMEMARVAESLGVPIHALGVGDFSGPYAADGANLARLATIAGGRSATAPIAAEWFAALASSRRVDSASAPWHDAWPTFAEAAGMLLLLEGLLRATLLRVRPSDD